MTTPICDFIRKYSEKATVRLHMPGHKGIGEAEKRDITEIDGADSLYEASGIIAESEKNAGALFGAHTFYSAEGSSLAIRAMLYLVSSYAKAKGEEPLIAAGRNVHKSFISGISLLDIPVDFLVGRGASYLSCPLTTEDVSAYLDQAERLPTALYLTSPDYLGRLVDVESIARVCHERGVLLLVDNAHGAYLKFLPVSRHPMDMGADVCSDSAHKTLHALTGAAYLHVSKNAPALLRERAKDALALFGSTSPSYLILASLDKLNARLSEGYRDALCAHLSAIEACKATLTKWGYSFVGEEPMKLTIAAKAYGYTGKEMAAYLRIKGIESEFSDPDYLVLMPSPDLAEDALARLTEAMLALPRKEALSSRPPAFSLPTPVLSPREAVLAPSEWVAVAEAEGRVLAGVTVGCPPAVPIVVSGERINKNAAVALMYYGFSHCLAVKEKE